MFSPVAPSCHTQDYNNDDYKNDDDDNEYDNGDNNGNDDGEIFGIFLSWNSKQFLRPWRGGSVWIEAEGYE